MADSDVEGAIVLAEQAAATLLAVGDLRNHLLALLDAAMIWPVTGAADSGAALCRNGAAPGPGVGRRAVGLRGFEYVGLAGPHGRRLRTSLALLEECLALAARMPNGKLIAWTHYKLGQVLLDYGDLAQAADHFAESSRLWRERDEVLAVAYCQSGEANCLLRQGDVAQAVVLYESTLVIYRQFDAQRAVAWTLWNLAQRAAGAEDSSRGRGYCTRA